MVAGAGSPILLTWYLSSLNSICKSVIRDIKRPSEADYILITEAILVGQTPLYFILPSSSSDTVLVWPLAIVSTTHAFSGLVVFRSYGDIMRLGCISATKV